VSTLWAVPVPVFDKRTIVADLRRRLEAQLDGLAASQRAAQDAAVHPEARQEHAKDMRATEASYVARGLAERVERLRDEVLAVERMTMREFDAGEPAAYGAIVLVCDDEGVEHAFLLAPAGGGEHLAGDGSDVVVLTGTSPLGRILAGRRAGDVVTADLPGGRRELEIVAVE